MRFFVNGSIISDRDLEDALELNNLDPENLWGGISYGWTF